MEINHQEYHVAGSNSIPMSLDISFPKSAKALPVVIYAHGINGFKDWGGMDLIAQKFAEAGFAFLKFSISAFILRWECTADTVTLSSISFIASNLECPILGPYAPQGPIKGPGSY